ncbi:hypothetical protein AcV7_002045 [Taiwanofungus camphoratus]|nr:hypothetical protein AcV7_002045 [Antrodia cinnamomea]
MASARGTTGRLAPVHSQTQSSETARAHERSGARTAAEIHGDATPPCARVRRALCVDSRTKVRRRAGQRTAAGGGTHPAQMGGSLRMTSVQPARVRGGILWYQRTPGAPGGLETEQGQAYRRKSPSTDLSGARGARRTARRATRAASPEAPLERA